MFRIIRRVLLVATCLDAAIAGGPAVAQGWNMYQPSSATVTVPFVSSILNPAPTGATVALNLPGMANNGQVPFTMDTGSTGIVVTKDHWNPGNLQPVGSGSITYNSSGVTNIGQFYLTTVNFRRPDGSLVASSANVKVLVSETQITCPPGTGSCSTNNNPTGVAYMGVGFDRAAAELSQVTPSMNPFLNLSAIGTTQIPAGTVRQGYIITPTGVILGLTAATTAGFSFAKLLPNPSTTYPEPWSAAQMAVTVNGMTANGTVLPDAGIPYMFLKPAAGSITSPLACPPYPGGCAPAGTTISLALPGSSAANAAVAQYGFTVGTPSLMAPE